MSPRFDVATTDEQILGDEIYHRLTTDRVIGFKEDGSYTEDAAAFGDDVRKLIGAALSEADINALGPRYAAVLQRSGRIETSDVKVTNGPIVDGEASLDFVIDVVSSTDVPFSFLFRLTSTTFINVGVTPGGS